MSTKNILIWIVVLVVVGGGVWYFMSDKSTAPYSTTETNLPNENGGDQRVGSSTTGSDSEGDGKLKVINFSGKLEEVDEGCYSDGECFVVIDGKHVTVIWGWRQEVVGSVLGVPSFGDLNNHIGDTFEVYAKDNGDGTYTLYGSEGFYIKLK